MTQGISETHKFNDFLSNAVLLENANNPYSKPRPNLWGHTALLPPFPLGLFNID